MSAGVLSGPKASAKACQPNWASKILSGFVPFRTVKDEITNKNLNLRVKIKDFLLRFWMRFGIEKKIIYYPAGRISQNIPVIAGVAIR